MLEELKHHGMFSWNELITPNIQAAKEFYSKLLGWQMEDMSTAPGMNYTIVKANDREIGGMMATPDETVGMPPMWGGYVTVDDVDSLVTRVVTLGGKIRVPPRNIPNVGRFCVIQDPQGAMLTLISYQVSGKY